MWILPFVGYAGVLFGFAFLTLAIGTCPLELLESQLTLLSASGLYYLSELVEEHTVPAKKFLTRLIYAVIVTQTLLLIDRFPFWRSVLSIGSHVIYLQNLRRFPLVQLSDPFFILSCGESPARAHPLAVCYIHLVYLLTIALLSSRSL